jgi:hypothetical protein
MSDMDDEITHDLSRLRQSLAQSQKQWAQLIKAIIRERGPVISGSFVLQPGRCGKPSCKCARGEFHSAAALYTREKGRQTCHYVPQDERRNVEKLNLRYKQLRKARAALAKLAQQTLKQTDALQQALTQPYPPAERTSKRKLKRRPVRRRKASS